MESLLLANPPEEKKLCLLRQDLELHPGPSDIVREPTWTVHDPSSGHFYRIGWREYAILSRWHLADAAAIVQAVDQTTPLRVTEEDVWRVDTFLRNSFLCRPTLQDAPKFAKAAAAGKFNFTKLLRSYLFFKIPLCRPDRFLEAVLPWVRWIFTRTFVYAILGLTLISLWLIFRQWEVFTGTFATFFRLEGLFAYGAALVFSKILHEFAHAITAKHYGLRVPTLGFALLVFWPLLYTDASQSWKIASRRKRMVITGAGILSELALAAVAGIVWTFLDDGSWRNAFFMLASTNWITTIIFNMNPFMRFDGYFLLADLMNMENLQGRAFAYFRWWTGELLFGFGDAAPERMPRRLKTPLLLYAVSTFIYRIGIIVGISLLVYHLFFKVLGILMLLLQIWQAVLVPLFKGGGKLWARRSEMQFSRTAITVVVFGGLLALLFVPLPSFVESQALLTADDSTALYAQEAGRLEFVVPPATTTVRENHTLFVLNSPELQYLQQVNVSRLERIRHELSVLGFSSEGRERRLLLLAELRQAEAREENLARREERLTIRASMSGQVEFPFPMPQKGDWVAKEQLLARIVNPASQRLTTYVQEFELHRIAVGASAKFFSSDGEGGRMNAVVASIDEHPANTLVHPLFLARYGGRHLAGDSETLAPQDSLYRVDLVLEEPLPLLAGERDGTVFIDSPPRIPMVRIWKKLWGTLLRETVF